MSFQIKRKAVPQRIHIDLQAPFTADPKIKSTDDDPSPAYEPTDTIDAIEPLTVEGGLRPDLDEQLEHLHLETDHEVDLSNPADEDLTEGPQSLGSDTNGLKSSKFQHTLREVRHFAGGLISRPFEATKHYSILRHSHGFVMYQGLATSVAITIFSDQALPPDRTLWLQKRGFSGKIGLKVGTLGTRSAWINVTPSIDATADSLPPHDERAWQRDITKFIKKAQNTKSIRNHHPYETHVVRIPHVAEDGYFRIVLCTGRKVLCPSPVFRYASSSLDPSVLRGASLTTIPLELGIRIGSLVANKAANTAAAGALQPTVSTIQTAVQPYQFAATTVYDASGAAERVNNTVDSLNQQYEEKRSVAATPVSGYNFENSHDGPAPPYPIRLSAKAPAASWREEKGDRMGTTAKLESIPQDTLLRLTGIYFGWASIARIKITSEPFDRDENLEKWLPALIVVAPERDQTATVVENKAVNVRIIHVFGGALSFDAKVSLMIMGFIRPSRLSDLDPHSQEQSVQEDIAVATSVLSRPAWRPETVLERIKSASSIRSFTERVADARQTGQRQLDRVPVHRLGVRTDSMGLKDRLIGTGGICIKR